MTVIQLRPPGEFASAQPCPGWCRSGAAHADQIIQFETSFFHQGEVHFIPGQHVDEDGERAFAEIYLSQREDVDNDGLRRRHPVSVIFEGASDFGPPQAATAATLLARLAESAREH